jgi:hypothetical protein
MSRTPLPMNSAGGAATTEPAPLSGARAGDPAIEMAADHDGLVPPNGVGLVASEFQASDPTVLDASRQRVPDAL